MSEQCCRRFVAPPPGAATVAQGRGRAEGEVGVQARGIKAAVVAMGIVIVIGFVVVVVTIVGRLSGTDEAGLAADIAVPLPPGCTLADAWSDAGRLFLRLAGAGDCQQVLIVDLESGAAAGRVTLAPLP